MDLPKEFSLNEIAAVAGGTVGAGGDVKVKRVAVSPLMAVEGDLALFFEPKLLSRLAECKATAALVPEGTECKLPHVVVKRPQLAMSRMLAALQPKRFFPEAGIHPTAVVDPTAEIGPDVAIGPLVVVGPRTQIGARTKISAGCVIGGAVKIGEDCLLHPGVLIADYVKVGNRVTLQQGASVGSDGFAYVTERPSNMELRMENNWNLSDEPNPLRKIPQIGTVVLEDDVEIGSNATIDRATMGATVIGAGTKIDNLVMVAHNCRIGKEVLIVAQTAVAGSCVLGDRVIIGGQAGISDHIRLEKDVIVQGTGGVMRDVEAGAVVTGTPAQPVKDFFKQLALMRRMPKIFDDVKDMKKKLEKLEQLLAEKQLEPVSSK